MTARPHDALFKAAFEQPAHAADLFRCVLPEALRASIDFNTLELESGSYIDPELADTHSDLLFSARMQGKPIYLYLLLEHQSTNDAIMPLRMMEYIVRIAKRHYKEHGGLLPLIIPLVISHAPGGWTGPVSFHQLVTPDPASIDGVAELVPSFTVRVEDLAHLTNEELRARTLSAFQKLALWLLRDARDIDELLRNAELWASAVGEALRTPLGLDAVRQLFGYVARITDPMIFARFRGKIQKQSPEIEEAIMTLSAAERWELDGSIKTMQQLLTIKFGEIPSEYLRRLEAATAAQIKRYTTQFVTAQSIAEVFAEPS